MDILFKVSIFLYLSCVVANSNKIVTRLTNLRARSGTRALDPRTGHGIAPNLRPRYSPPVQTEHLPEMRQLLLGEMEAGQLPNTWETVPSYR